MRSRILIVLAASATLVLGGFAGAVGATTGAPAAAQRLSADKIVVNFSKDPQLASQFLIAQHRGYFKEAGLDATMKTWADGSQIPAAMAAGKVDVAQSVESDALTIIGQGAPVKIIAGISNISAVVGLVLPAKTKITKPSDLEGKTIGGTKAAYLTRWLDGFCRLATPTCNPNKINVVNVDPPDHPTVLQSGSVDGVISFPPYLVLTAQNGAYIAADGAAYHMSAFKKAAPIWQGEITVYVREDFIKKHRDTLIAYLKALKKANDFINADKKRAAKILLPDFGVKEDVLLRILKLNRYGMAIDKAFVAEIAGIATYMYKAKQIPKNPPASQIVDASVLKEAIPSLVKVTT